MIRLVIGAIGACCAVVVAVDLAGTEWAIVYAAAAVALAFGCDQLSPSRSSLTRYERWQERDERRRAA